MKRLIDLIILVIAIGTILYIAFDKIKLFNVINVMLSGSKTVKYDENFMFNTYDGEDYFSTFLENGGANSEHEVLLFLAQKIINFDKVVLKFSAPGCSTIQIYDGNNYLFGRNYDYDTGFTYTILDKPKVGYKSISTVNINEILEYSSKLEKLPNELKTLAGLYLPLDGMNEEGLAVSINMIKDSSSINQKSSNKNITPTTGLRLLLNYASDVDSAIALLKEYNMHSSTAFHYMIADKYGNSKTIEYIENEINVVDTKILTNHYLNKGNKYLLGSKVSIERYKMINDYLNNNDMNYSKLVDVLTLASDTALNEYSKTQWSVIYNQNNLDVTYYNKGNFDVKYNFKVN